jgi:hypothetical protein
VPHSLDADGARPVATAQTPRPNPVRNADSAILLDLPISGTDSDAIDYTKLPVIKGRQMFVAVSRDGLVFTRMFLLDIPSAARATIQYPHVLEHEGKLLIAYSANKTMIELLTIDLIDIGPVRKED